MPFPRGALAVRYNADLAAHIEDGASRALWPPAGADVLAERHEQAVKLDPVIARQLAMEYLGSFFGSVRIDIAPAIGHAVVPHRVAGVELRRAPRSVDDWGLGEPRPQPPGTRTLNAL
jgi:hypothetical protein